MRLTTGRENLSCAERLLNICEISFLLSYRDLQLTMPLGELRYLLRLDDLINTAPQPITVLEISAKDGQGLNEVIKWLAANSKGGL